MQQISALQPIKEIDSLERKSSNFREEVTGSNGNTNKFVDKEEHEFSSDNYLIHDEDTSSETDQQEHLIDISREGEQVEDAQDDFKETFLRNTGVNLNTLSDLCRSDLPEVGMFTREIEPIYSIGFSKNV